MTEKPAYELSEALAGTRFQGISTPMAGEPKAYPVSETGAEREKLHHPGYGLMPFLEVSEAFARVAEYGAQKYSDWNWSNGLPRSQVIASLLRHTWAYLRGEDRDPESGLLHTDHILWNACVLAHHVDWGIGEDRRPEPKRDYHDKK